jgi:phosphate transport system substrate-binding protein
MKWVKISFVILAAGFIFLPEIPAQETTNTANSMIYYGCDVAKKAFMEEVSKAYKEEKGIDVQINGGGATKGIRFASAGKADLGGGCRHKLFSEEEKDAVGTIVAWDALVIIVNKENPVEQIPGELLMDIFTGKIKNWKELGGVDAPIALYTRGVDASSGTGHSANELIFNNTDIQYSEEAIKLTSSSPVEMGVETNPHGIGITGISSGRKRDLKFLRIGNVEPSYENIASGKYEYFRPLYLYTNKTPTAKAVDFLTFVLSEKGQKIIQDLSIVTIADAKAGGLYEKYDAKMEAIGVHEWERGEGHEH